ncbi:MAG: cation diffusion facilitator family transporter, partial [Roseburia sp.]|nr:cation diffusion facilitator family transporter [Roseburia sp.]
MEKKIAMRVSMVSIIVNLVLSLIKLLAGLIASSGAMVSDAVHSASDVFSTVIVMIGVHVSGKKSDKDHQYGHERLECVASIVLAVILCITGFGIGYSGIQTILDGDYEKLAIPGRLALAAALFSIVVKEWMFWYTRSAARKINSGALMADAWHHRSDSLSSVGALIGIFGSRMGYPVLDSAASVVISIFIMKAAYDIFKDAVDKMVDKAC